MPGEQPSADASAGKLGRRGRRTLVAAMAVAALALGITGWRIADDHGRLGGIAVASFATERLRSYHSRLRLGHSGMISIFRNDGVLLTRQPAAPDTLGRSYVGTPLFDAAANTGSHGLFTTRFRSDGIQRRAAIRHVDGMPLLVSAGLAEDEILAPLA